MKVACIQLSSTDNYHKNCKEILKYINIAISKKSDFIMTPETSSIISDNKKKLFKFSYEMRNDPLLKNVKKIAKNKKKWIMLGSVPIKVGKKLRNRSILINHKGKIQKYYDKINMFDVKVSTKEIHNESKIYKAGKKLALTTTPWGKLGFTICFDLRFPELYRKLSKNNLNFITVPSAFTKITGQKHWLKLLMARAIENFCFIFAPNQTGKNTNKRETFGHSVIISPDGEVIKLKKEGKGIIYADIDPNHSINLRKKIPTKMK